MEQNYQVSREYLGKMLFRIVADYHCFHYTQWTSNGRQLDVHWTQFKMLLMYIGVQWTQWTQCVHSLDTMDMVNGHNGCPLCPFYWTHWTQSLVMSLLKQWILLLPPNGHSGHIGHNRHNGQNGHNVHHWTRPLDVHCVHYVQWTSIVSIMSNGRPLHIMDTMDVHCT